MASHSFPQFSDGNVEIHFSSSNDEKFILHSSALALHSSWFKASLSERWSGGGDQNASAGGTHRLVYELRFDKGTDVGTLMRKPISPTASADTEVISSSKATFPNGTAEAVVDLNTQRIAKVTAHQDMLSTLYHIQPAFSHSSFESARNSILQLADIAGLYGCEHVIKLHVENHLHLYRTEVLDICASSPVSMLELAVAVKSEWIYMEAATNLLGQSNVSFDEAQARLSELKVADDFNKKRSEFSASLRSCELEMFCIRPTSLASWVCPTVVGFFRHWLSDELHLGEGSGLCLGYARVYRTIAEGKLPSKARCLTYLSSTFGDSADIYPTFEANLKRVFTFAADIIQPILVDLTRRQEKPKNVHQSLLFMSIGDDELPWVRE